MLKGGQDVATSADVVADPSGIRKLTQKIVEGDERAFETFFHEYSRRLYAFLLVLTSGDEHLTKEVQQIVLIRVARRFQVFDSEGQLWAWLTTIARNAFLDLVRKEGRQTRRCVAAQEDLKAAAESDGEHCLDNLLTEALAMLPEDEDLLIKMFYFSENTQIELASHSGCTVKAVQSRLARIRAKLREMLCHKLKDYE